MGAARPPRPDATEPEDSPDLVDVPAAVICALCGAADCPGCRDERDASSRSGVIVRLAWERPGVPVLARLWSTSLWATRDAEGFFERLADGPLMPAVRFAVLAELLACSAMLAATLALAAIVAPGWLAEVALDPSSRALALTALVLAVPGLAGLVVVAHVAHGLALDLAAMRLGARSARSCALRFGLYSCGWDLVLGPIGVVVVALREGGSAALELASSLAGLPTRATRAFLRGSYRLAADDARRAIGLSYLGATVATAGAALVGLAAVAALILS